MEQYRQEWEQDDDQVRVLRTIEQGDVLAMEIAVAAPTPDGTVELGGIVVHRWAADRPAEYRLYIDPSPSQT